MTLLAQGWSDNPVEFDHVLNRSRHSWAWGSPDIVPMFARWEAGSSSAGVAVILMCSGEPRAGAR